MAPPFSPTFMSPSQSVSTPVRPNEISKPVLALSNVLATMFVNTAWSPRKMRRIRPTTRATRKNETQM